MNSSLVSVIVPVYNPGEHFSKCSDSLINQTHKDIEISFIDDGSNDSSALMCDYCAKNDNRIITIHKPNEGVSRARNIGIDIANGEYYYFPDSDDYIELDTFEYCLKLINENNCDAVVFEHFVTFPNNEVIHQSPNEYYGLYEGKDEIIKIYFRTAFTCNKFFIKKLITSEKFSPGIKFREDIFRGEDGIFSREALNRADKVYFTNRAMYHYIQSQESACRGKFKVSQLSLLKTIDVTNVFFKNNFPQYLPKLLINELESYIMLYSDMYFDESDYSKECNDIYLRFKMKKETVKNKELSLKQKIKFNVFYYNPKLYCYIHDLNVKRLEK